MHHYSANLFFIAIGVFLLVFLLVNRYWGTFIILLSQPFFITAVSEGSGVGPTKIVYGVLFAAWFGVWALTKVFGSNSPKTTLAHSMVLPTFAFGTVLAFSMLVGFLYGSSPGNIIRDLSQYVGYLAVLPLLDLVQTPKQAKRLVIFLAMVGLPSSILTDIWSVAAKQDIEMSPALLVCKYASPYWGPIQGALWAVAVSFSGFFIKLLVWLWLIFKSSLSIFSGFRGMLLKFILTAMTAFLVSGRIVRHSLARYMIPLFLILMVGGLLADLSGMIKLPLSDITRNRYSTLLSENKFQKDYSIQGRVIESRALLKAFLKNPITGIGLGHSLRYRTLEGTMMDKSRVRFRYHNGYLETFMKFGILGSAIFAWYFLTLFLQAFEVVRTTDSYFAKTVALGLIIFLVPSLAGSIAGSAFSNRGFALTIGVMAGLLPALRGKLSEAKEAQPEFVMPATERLRQFG
jgi:O-antigen ligase